MKVFYAGKGYDSERRPVTFIAMEWVKGFTLMEWRLARRAPNGEAAAVNEREVVAAIIAAIDALDSLTVATAGPTAADSESESEAVELPLLHLDLSPMNILVAGELGGPLKPGGLKLIDFAASAMLHTAGYTAPDRLVKAPGSPSETWDVYSLGGLIYFLLAGVEPGQPPTEKVDFAKLPGDIDRSLKAIIEKSLSEQPGQRFQTRKALRKALNHYVRDYPVADVGLTYRPRERLALLVRRARVSENIVAQSKLWSLVYVWSIVNIAFWLALCWILPGLGMDRLTAFNLTGFGLSTCSGLATLLVAAITWRGALMRQLTTYTVVYLAAYWLLRLRIDPGFGKAASIQVLLSACFAIVIGVSQRAFRVWVWIGAGLFALAFAAPRITESPTFDPVQDATLQASTLAIWLLGFALTFGLRSEEPESEAVLAVSSK